MALEWNKLYKLGTDVAAFLFFHPKQLQHRTEEYDDWWTDDRELSKEFQAGRLFAFCTGSDGAFTLKFVRRPLTVMENKVLVTKQQFRYQVQGSRVFWDNSNCLPSNDQLDRAEEDPDGWLKVKNGMYKVTVHAMDWYSVSDSEREAEKDISHYIVRLESVDTLRYIRFPKKLPWLICNKEWHRGRTSRRRKPRKKK